MIKNCRFKKKNVKLKMKFNQHIISKRLNQTRSQLKLLKDCIFNVYFINLVSIDKAITRYTNLMLLIATDV